MTARRIDAGALVGAAGALLLIVSLFLDWYGSGEAGHNAWTVFEVLDLLLAAIGLLALSTLISRSGIERRAPEVSLIALGAGSLVIVVSQLLNHPPAAPSEVFDIDTGAWLALTGSALLLAGAIMSVAKISLAVEHRERTERTETAEPEPAETVKLTDPERPA